MTRRNFLTTASLATLGTIFVPNLAFSKESLTIWGAPALISLPLAYAVNNGKIRSQKSVKLSIWKSPDQLRSGFASGDFVLSSAPSNVGVNLAHKGLNVRVLNIMTQGLNYIFAKSEGINSLKDLEGKSIIVPFKNDLPDIVFMALCDKFGVDKSKVKIHYAPNPPAAVQLFIAKSEFDAVLSQEPLASAISLMAKKNGLFVKRAIDVQRLFKEAFNTQIYQAGLIVNGDFYAKNSQFFSALHGDLQDALKWIKINETSAANLGAKYLPAPEAAIKSAIPNANLVALKASEIYEDLMKFYEVIFAQNPAFLGGKMPEKELFL